MSGKRTIIVTTKNEGPFILEWVVYHRLIGFDNLVVFANDCEDGSDHLLTALHDIGLIKYYDNSEVPEGLPADPQNRAYRRAFAMDHVTDSEWVLVIDADEFFNIRTGDGTIDDLLEAMGPADLISGTWRVFGNSGIIPFSDTLVTAQFTRCAPSDIQISFRHFGFKTMFRPNPVHRLGIHRPFFKGKYKRTEEKLMWRNGSGEDVTRFYREKGWSSSMATKGYDLCQVNHYMIKSNELFLMKRYRGTANSTDTDRINFDYYDSFNSNHTTDTGIHKWTDRINNEIAQIIAKHPHIGESHQASVEFFQRKIKSLVKSLKSKDPEVYNRLLDKPAVMAQIESDERALIELRNKRPETKRSPKSQTSSKEDGPKKSSGVEPEKKVVQDSHAAPIWLADLRHSNNRKGFYHSDEIFAAHFADRGEKHLIISFDNLSNVKDKALSRSSWGYEFYRDEGWSHFGVFSFAANWYRDDALFDYLEGLAESGFFQRFSRVTLTGTSMGAYAAAAFSRLIPGCVVLAFSPQSTLSKKLVPWEKRFNSGRKQDWNGRFHDAAEKLDAAEQVFILNDPGFDPDERHAQRFSGENITHLKTWFSHHKSALFLRRAEILKPIVRLAVSRELTCRAFYSLYRNRRNLPWYINGLTEKALTRGHNDLVSGMAQALVAQGRPHLSRSVQNRVNNWDP